MEYAVVKIEGGNITGYWNGSIFQPDINLSAVQVNIQDARLLQGQVQIQDPSFDVEYREVDVSIVLV